MLRPNDTRRAHAIARSIAPACSSYREAYAIAANYLRRSGAIPDTLVTDERLLGIIIKLLQQGEFNKIRLANTAIARFEAQSDARAVA